MSVAKASMYAYCSLRDKHTVLTIYFDVIV